MTVVTNNQKRCIRLFLHHFANIVIHGDVHVPNHILMLIGARILRMVWITVPPEIVLNTIGRGEVREQDIHILVLDCQPSQPDFFINFCKELVPQSGQILFRGKLSIGAQNINSRIIDALLALRIDTNLSLVRTSNHQAVDFPAFLDVHRQNYCTRKSLFVEYIPESFAFKGTVIKHQWLICILFCSHINKVNDAMLRRIKTSINRGPCRSCIRRENRAQVRVVILLHQAIQIGKFILVSNNHIPVHTVNAKNYQFSYHFLLLSNYFLSGGSTSSMAAMTSSSIFCLS